MGALTLLWASAAAAANGLSLAGDWRFEIAGATEGAFARELKGTIRLPGTMDDAGLGPKNTKEPTLEGPYRNFDYAGPAWYQRTIDIPAVWSGKRVSLFLERCRWVTSVWLDERFIGSQDSLSAPHVYDFGIAIAPGPHRLTVCVDNTVKLNLGKFVSALFGGTWGNMNGIIGRIELAATPPVWIEGVQIYPDDSGKRARVAVNIGNATGRDGHGTLEVGNKKVEVAWTTTGGHADLEVPLGDAPRWDEFAPNLRELTVKLGDDRRTVRFGVRQFATQGTQLTLNGRPIFLRGTLECSVFPLTGYPPTDVASWARIYRILHSYGLNHMRFHSWCPPEAAFTAADEAGIMLQVEGPQANVPAGADPARDAFIEAEYRRIVDTYGNHPSFCLMALGNEFGGKDELLTGWVEMLIQRDPRHLYTSASNNRQRTANRQFTVSPAGRGIPGAGTDRDLRAVVAGDPHPVLGHEIGQWMYYPDFNEMKKYRGVMSVRNFELIRDDLTKKGLLDLAPQYVQASGRFATLLYKEEIEVLLRTPGYAGFALLDLHDYPTQGTALIGPLDPFWDSKGFITPEEFRRFCAPTVPLLRMLKRTYSADESLSATAEVAHFGAADLDHAEPAWTISDAQNREIASGVLPPLQIRTGRLTTLGRITASLTRVTAPEKLKVTLSLRGTAFANDWEIWVYPSNQTPQPPAGVVACSKWDEAKTALAAGRKVVFFAGPANPTHAISGRFLPVFWSPVWFPTQKPNTMGLLCDPRHPLLAHFPTEFHSNWQWHDLMQHSRLYVLDETLPAYRPLVQVIDNFARNHKLGLIFEGRAGDGQLLVCGVDLPALSAEPVARQLLASVYAYVGSAKFAPAHELGAEMLQNLFVPTYATRLQALGAKVRADSSAGEFPPEHVIDGRANTLWHTSWDENARGFPHHLIVELPEPLRLVGLTCLPRQDHNPNGVIKDYAVYTSENGRDWGSSLAQGTFLQGNALQTVTFAHPVTTRFLKFVAVSGFDATKPFASLAEFDVIQVQ